MFLTKHLATTTALPLIRRLMAEQGLKCASHEPHNHPAFPVDSLSRMVFPTTSIAYSCVDTRFQIWDILGARTGEIATLPEPGVVLERKRNGEEFKLLTRNFPEIRQIGVYGHIDCRFMLDRITSGKMRPKALDSAMARTSLSLAQLQVLASMYQTLSSVETLASLPSVVDKVQSGEMDLVAAFIVSEERSTAKDKTKHIDDRIALYDPNGGKFVLPESKSHLKEVLRRAYSGGNRIKAIRDALKQGKLNYIEAVKRDNTEAVPTLRD